MTVSSNSPEPDGAPESARAASVDRGKTAAGTQWVGVLSTHNSKETKAVLNAVRVLGHEPVWIRNENVASRIEDGDVRPSTHADVLETYTLDISRRVEE